MVRRVVWVIVLVGKAFFPFRSPRKPEEYSELNGGKYGTRK